jgi:hypothetical protein
MNPLKRLVGGLVVAGLVILLGCGGSAVADDDPRPDPDKLEQLKAKFGKGKLDPAKLAQLKEKLEQLKEKIGPEKFDKLMEKFKDRKGSGEGDADRREKLKALLEKLKQKE